MATYLFVSYSGVLGGAERVLLDAADAMDGTALLACPAGPLACAAASAGLTTLVLPHRSLRVRGGSRRAARAALDVASHALELRRLARDVEPDLVVAWGMRSAIAAVALPRQDPFAFAHHDFLPGPIAGMVVRRVARRARMVIVPSHAVKADLDPRGRMGDSVRVISPGVEMARFAEIGPPLSDRSVLVLGALARWKRPDLAFDVASVARHDLPDLVVRVVGGPVTDDEPFVDELRERASRRELAGVVTLTGAVTDPRTELEAAACLLHCSPAEPFGIAILEALAAGRPVVVPDSGGPPEIVDASCAELYPAGDAAAAAQAIIRVLINPSRARQMGSAGRARVSANFTAEHTRQGFRRALASVNRQSESAAEFRPSDLTIVTVAHNSAAELRRLVASRDAHLPGTPLIVVDCASRDDSVSAVRGQPGVQVIPLSENLGFGRACNRGLREVASSVVALLNPDVELIDSSLLTLADETQRADRADRLLAPLLLNRNGTRQQTVHPVPSSPSDIIRAVVPPAVLPGSALAPWRARRPQQVGWAAGAALVASTETLRRLGPFDESIFMYGEDMELGLRAAKAGIMTWFWPSTRVLHAGAHSTDRAFGGEAFTRLAQARQEAVTRRLGTRRARLDRRVQTVTFASRILYRTLLGRPAERERRQLAATRALSPASGPPVPFRE
jgi:N-acetylglucosaminyl-diphospho-decaprenol L-rhamnosyltransferase